MALGGGEEFFLEFEEEGLEFGLDLADDVEIGGFLVGVIGVAGVVNVFAGGVFVDDFGKGGEIGEEGFYIGGGGEGTIEEGLEERLDVVEVGGVEIVGYEGGFGGGGGHGGVSSDRGLVRGMIGGWRGAEW